MAEPLEIEKKPPRTDRRTPNFDDKRLAKAIEIRDHSYRLLLWISDAVDQDLIQPSRVAHHSGGPDAAIEWLRLNYFNIPEHLRPARGDLDEFAAFFSTYLTSSFDVVENPGTRGTGPTPRYGCCCELCLRIVNAPHLQAKKLYARDKRRADILMVKSVMDLARQHALEIAEPLATRLVTDDATRRDAAYVSYGDWLLRRLDGTSDGPAVLALWRLIAWDPRGGMRRGFTLELKDFHEAEKKILASIRSVTSV